MGLFRNRGITDDEKKRLPPGQHMVRDFPVLHAGRIPYKTPPRDWDFKVWGLVDRPEGWDFKAFRALPTETVTTDIHCVTAWSKLDTVWQGVSLRWLMERVGVQPEATHVVAYSEEDYTANMPVGALQADDVLLAYRFGGEELDPEHGGPLRLLVPSLYFWKSAKWLRGLEFRATDRPGFWERYGYSNSADPWKEERYAF